VCLGANTWAVIPAPGDDNLILVSDLTEDSKWRFSNMPSGGGSGTAELPTVMANKALTTSYAELVAAPILGIRKVKAIIFSNNDATVTAVFYFKLIKNDTDYFIFKFRLAPGEKAALVFPIHLDYSMSIEAKVSVSCSGEAEASYLDAEDGSASALLNFTGTAFADLLVVPEAATYSLLGTALANTDMETGNCAWQLLNTEEGVMELNTRCLPPGSTAYSELPVVLSSGQSIQVKHGVAGKTGSALVTFEEV